MLRCIILMRGFVLFYSRFLYSVSTSTEEVVLRPITEDISAPGAARLPRVTSSACESLSSGADLITAAGGSLPQASFDFRLLSASGYQAAVLAMPSRLAEGKDNGTSQGPDHWRVIGWRRPGGTGKVAKGRSADLHRHRGSSPPLLMSHTGQVSQLSRFLSGTALVPIFFQQS